MKLKTKKVLRTIAAFLFFAALMYYIFVESYPARQARNLEKAERHNEILRKEFASNKKFMDIRFGCYTGGGGCLGVYGKVNSKEDLDLLKEAVLNTNPPVKVVYSVTIEAVEEHHKK